MKKIVYLVVLVIAFVLSTFPSQSRASYAVQKQSAVARFNEPVVVQGIVLKGEYLFVHDDAAMARGEACTYIYKGVAPLRDKLVVSFHCIPAERAKASHFVWRTAQTKTGTVELREFQFGGQTESHLIPSS